MKRLFLILFVASCCVLNLHAQKTISYKVSEGKACIISNFESIMMSKFESMLKIMMRRIYHIEIQRIKENWERSADCSQFLKLPALNFENYEENTLANLGMQI